ncbi:MAG: tetratricopeptide repeat protein [Halieaceae bacterium]|jgi:tetratricopeptide (TPR) repeat protein|nr:tetratricopeptide repeat protein [Halieaceae bacterium]
MSDISQQLIDAQQALVNKDLDAANRIIAGLATAHPDDPNVRYLACLLLRLQGCNDEAMQSLQSLTSDVPDHARAFQEMTTVALAINEPKLAHAAAERAVELDPALMQCWQFLIPLRRKFSPSLAEAAAAQLDFLRSLPPELRTVISYLANNKVQDAERLAKHFLRDNKTHPEGMRLLAEVLTRKNILDEAQFLLETLVALQPKMIPARLQLFHVLMRRQRFHSAFDIAASLNKDAPTDTGEIKRAYAAAAFAVGNIEEAKDLYAQLAKSAPADHLIPISQGHIFNAIGERENAVAAFQRCISLKPAHGDSYWSLANTKSYRFDDDEIASMQKIEEGDALSTLDRVQICFALGKALEDKNLFDDAFSYYDRGNSLKLPTTHYDPVQLRKRVQAQIDVCTSELFESRQHVGVQNIDPIFIVGLPRAGSTLLEQILASHSQVDGTMELHNVLDLAKRLRGRDADQDGTPRYPAILGDLDNDLFAQFGAQFIDQTRIYRGSGQLFIDKMPNNFFHIGLIKLILPNAKIIDARRHPMACCFSGYKQLFGEGQEFSYGLSQIGEYYKEYVRLMAHWDAVLPGHVLRVNHEDVVADLETQVHRILDYCGLEFESACLEFHKTERTVRTPSAEQVRQPIYTSGLEQWKNFEHYLAPLKEALGSELLNEYQID